MTTPTPSASPRSADLSTITTALEDLCGPEAATVTGLHLVTVVPHLDHVDDSCTWHGTLVQLAAAICDRLNPTGPGGSPVEQAEAAKGARDVLGEVQALTAGYDSLRSAPWYPARAGDLVHAAYEAFSDVPAYGETYAVTEIDDRLELVLVHNSAPQEDMCGWYAPGMPDDPLMEIWMEAGADRLTVVRDGLVLHNGPSRGGR